MTSRAAGLLLFAAVVVVALVLDQASKWLVLEHLRVAEPLPVTGFLNLTLVFNRGAAFGFLNDAAGWQLLLFATIAVLVVVYLAWQITDGGWRSVLTVYAFGLIAGGALGNLVDRVRFGHVVDFIDVHFGGWHFWIFNVADSALSVGVALVLLEGVIEFRRERARTGGGRA